jgi:hypothetical protein
MRDYCVELVEDNELQRQASFNLLVNGYRRAAWVEARKGHAPSYLSPQETTRLLRLRPC